MPWRSAAVLTLDPTGRYLDADQEALDLLGVGSVEDLRDTDPSVFQAVSPNPADVEALGQAFTTAAFEGMLAEGAIRRLDGELVRIRTAVMPLDGGGYRALLYPVERPTVNLTQRVYRIADVLAEWRSAERRLVDLDPASEDAQRLAEEVVLLRAQYQELFQRRATPGR